MEGQLRASRQGIGLVRTWALALSFVLCAVPLTSWSQETDVDSGEDDVTLPLDPADEATEAGGLMQQGLSYYGQQNFPAASLLFYRVLTDGTASDTVKARAEYELGRSMYRMRLYYGALYYFDGIVTVGPDHPMFVHSYPWLLRLARRLPGEPNMLDRLSGFADFFPDQIDEKYRDQMAFLIGRYFYSVGELQDSLRFLSYVSPASRYYGEAQFFQGVGYIQQYEGQAAADSFGEVIRFVLDSGDRSDEMRRLAEVAVLSMARTLYSSGDYERSIAYYDQVPSSSRYWLDALFERSWALFQMGEYNRALGNLHSLNSPFFNDEFYPEGQILAAVIFFRNCNFDAVREAVDEFRLDYGPLLDQLEDINTDTGTESDYYDLVLSIRNEQEQEFSPQLQRILNTVLSDRTVTESLQFVEEMNRELTQIQGADAGWLNTALADEILTETGLAASVGVSTAGEITRIRIRRARDELRRLMSQAQAILVETDLAEQAVMDEQLRDELNLSDAGLTPPNADAEHLLWHFQGEYWLDELGHYWYALRSRCSEMGL